MAGHTIRLIGDTQKQHAINIINQAPENYVVTVKEPKRSLEQNDKMWAMLTDLSIQKAMGKHGTPDEWKDWVMRACGHEVQFTEGLDGKPFPVGLKTSKLRVKQMIDLIEWMYAFGAEQGVQWTDPIVKADQYAA